MRASTTWCRGGNAITGKSLPPHFAYKPTSVERLARKNLLSTPTWKQPRGHPRARSRDYIFDLASFRIDVDVEPEQLSEIAKNSEVVRVLPVLLSPRLSPEEKREWNWIDEKLTSSNVSDAFMLFPLNNFVKESARSKGKDSGPGSLTHILREWSPALQALSILFWSRQIYFI